MLTIRSILAASDLSESSDEVVRTASALAGLTGAQLHLLHAVAPPPGVYPRQPAGLLPTTEEGLQAARAALEEQARRAGAPGVPATSRSVVLQHAHPAILQRASETRADLIVLGPSRPGPPRDVRLGTTADRVVRTAEAPCWIARGHPSLPLRRILIPTDLSSAARAAVETALAWGAALGAHTTVGAAAPAEARIVHVASGLRSPDGSPPALEHLEAELHAQVLAATRQAGRERSVKVWDEVVYADGAADEILRLVDEYRPDLLVMGTHGDSALARALVGSVSSAVTRRADCPVLLVPPPSGWTWRAPESAGAASRSPLPIP